MAKYLNIEEGKPVDSTTCIRENEDGQHIIQTDLNEGIKLSENPGEMALSVGKAIRGSLRVVSLGGGRYGIRARPFQHDSEAAVRQTPENIASTTHGRVYRTARRTKIVFDFEHDISFEKLLDHLDDELWDLKQTLEKEAPC